MIVTRRFSGDTRIGDTQRVQDWEEEAKVGADARKSLKRTSVPSGPVGQQSGRREFTGLGIGSRACQTLKSRKRNDPWSHWTEVEAGVAPAGTEQQQILDYPRPAIETAHSTGSLGFWVEARVGSKQVQTGFATQ